MSKTIDDLRAHLFAALDDLRKPEAPMEIERAKAIADIAQVVINTGKLEVEFARATGHEPASGFLTDAPKLPPGVTGVRTHRLKG